MTRDANLFSRPIAGWAVLLWVVAMATVSMANAEDRGDTVTPGFDLPFKVHFLAFGDVYHVKSHHLPHADGTNDLWFRRLYLTFDKKFNDALAARLRFEGNQDGDFINDDLTAKFKDVYLRWSVGRHQVFFGLSPTPVQDLTERVWGYRHLEKTPLDLQGLPARGNGIAAHGSLTGGDKLKYRLMLDSGADFGTETGEGQKLQTAITWGGDRGWLVDVYGDHQRLSGETDRTTFQVFTAYRTRRGRVALQYAYQDRQDDPRLELASTFGVVELTPKIVLVGRVDRLLAPSPKGNDIDYLPFSPRSKATLLIAATELRFNEIFSLMPNVETIFYDHPTDGGPRPEDDLLLRLTFYVHL